MLSKMMLCLAKDILRTHFMGINDDAKLLPS